jgi:ACS family hexuronate transporter-like MFS transporter
LSSALLKKGWSLNASRKTALLVCALTVTPIMIAAHSTNAWLVVFLIALAAGSHQGWSANVYTLASDMFPRSAVASVVGFGTMAGAISGMMAATAIGFILQHTGSYVPVFILAGLAYLVAFGFVQALVPRLKPAQL